MNPKFSLDKLPSAVSREAANPLKGRFFRVVHKSSGYQFVCGYKPELVEHIRQQKGDVGIDICHEISDDADAALKLLEMDIRRAWDLLKEVVKHVSAGNYNDTIIERLRSICEAEKLHTAEAILASVPPRQSQGPVEEWCMHAIQLFCEMRYATWQAKKRIEETHILSDGV